MNRLHRWLCRSGWWRTTIQQRLPWVLEDVELGPNVLELGPGPGLTTDVLRHSVERLTALELDARLADALATRFAHSNVEVVTGDATATPFLDGQFSACVAFTMLHHVPSSALQDTLLREVCRILQPGGVFAGSDSLQSLFMRVIHIGDTLVPVSPDKFAERLTAAGFEKIEMEKNSRAFRFRARRPTRLSNEGPSVADL